MLKKIIFILLSLLSFYIFSCGEKTVYYKNKIAEKRRYQTLQKAKANFEELEKEAKKSPEQLTLPQSKEEAIMPKIENKPIMEQPKIYKKEKIKIYKRKVETKYPLKNGYPIWVYNPNYGGYIGAVGIAKKTKGGYPEQKRIAVMIAQANLAKQIRLIVNSEVYTEKIRISRKDFEEYKSKLKSLSKQEASLYLKNTVVKDEWIDPKTGDLYVWVVLKK